MIPVWMQFPKLQLRYWTSRILSRIASLLGNPLEMDEMTTMGNRTGYSRVLAEMKINETMPEEVWFDDENGVVQQQKVKYEWNPVKCLNCKGYGHESTVYRKPQAKAWKGKRAEGQTDKEIPTEATIMAKGDLDQTEKQQEFTKTENSQKRNNVDTDQSEQDITEGSLVMQEKVLKKPMQEAECLERVRIVT
ncbi:OLC1v1016590C1 [Oldenlandia corymbosa var. corymbosa]|uniref:OLC1v1016590C1 n=1 Tax=Oldenlandia corymbosa var. corymbosa TaxID=529605 RepID=A0AAV1E7J0_OLDCO|nr:OLC1v1016590C1 [Oldenlandia corymbosa var. corymbosa]